MKPADITSGNSKLNLAFVANLFNVCPGLEMLSQEEVANFEIPEEGSREARAFALWLNSLGIDPVIFSCDVDCPLAADVMLRVQYVNNLFEDLRDGLVLLRAEDAIEKGSVDWKQVKEGRINNFQKIGNCQGMSSKFWMNVFSDALVCSGCGHGSEAAVQVLACGHPGRRCQRRQPHADGQFVAFGVCARSPSCV